MPRPRSVYINLGFPDLIQRARSARERAGLGHRAGVDAVLYSALALEAFPNDFAKMASLQVTKSCPREIQAARDLLPELERERVQVRLKFQLLYLILTGSSFPRGEQPYQDFDFLIDLRNEIAHHKIGLTDLTDTEIKHDERSGRFIGGLRHRRLIAKTSDSLPHNWKMLLDESDDVAKWAFETARKTVTLICKAVPECPFREKYIEPFLSPHATMNRSA